jgi:hypothetical protein
MTDVSIEIKGKKLKLEFGLSLFRILGRKWQLPGVNEVIQKMAVTFNNTEKNLSFDQLDVLEDILNAAIENGDNTIDVSQLKVVDEFFKNPKAMELLTQSLMDSIPKADPDDTDGSQGKPKVVKATKAKRN